MIREFKMGSYKKGDLVLSNGIVWEAKRDMWLAIFSPSNGKYWKQNKCHNITSIGVK